MDRYIPKTIQTLEKDYHLVAGSKELGFKRAPCEWCRSQLHGDRFEGVTHQRNTHPIVIDFYSICIDCLAYAANGYCTWDRP